MSCYIPDIGAATLKELPPSDVACIVWPANKSLKYVAETGCEADLSSITASLNEKCTGYFAASELPVEKCDQGLAVQLMQSRLRKAGYNTSVDGYYGPEMALAVYKFQKGKGLLKSGTIDEATWKALEPNQSALPGTDANGDGIISPNEFR
jgi:peptidoglycan hydrolase-like protein with peptidoglycan-binding domain